MNISVIIPLYNAEKFIGKALESCLQFPEVKEIIVVNDGYMDNAENIVKSYAEKFPIIRLFAHPDNENLGAGASRNLGIEKATQEYISFLDADDFFLPSRFEKDKEIFAKYPDADGCYNAIGSHFYSEKAKENYFKSFNSTLTTVNSDLNPNPENLFAGLIGYIENYGRFSLDGLTIKKTALEKSTIKFTDFRIHQDSIYILLLANKCKLYPSEIQLPTAMRGVHDENRITKNNNSLRYIKSKNQFLYSDYIYKWAIDNDLKDRLLLQRLKDKSDFYRLLSVENPKPSMLLKEVIINRKILKNYRYLQLHRVYFEKNKKLGVILFRLRNLFVKCC